MFLFLVHCYIFRTKTGGTTPKNNDGTSDAGTNWLMFVMERFLQVCITWPLFQITNPVPLYCSRYDIGKCMLETIPSHPVCMSIQHILALKTQICIVLIHQMII